MANSEPTLVDAAAAAICERRNADDEFWEGIWWVPDGTGKVRNATPGECAAEIKRLRGVIIDINVTKVGPRGGVYGD